MATKEIRQQARKAARDMLAEKRKQRVELEHKRDGLAAQVMVALAERDALVKASEVAAGKALNELISSGLSVADAVEWCAGLVEKEVRRLTKLADDAAGGARTLGTVNT